MPFAKHDCFIPPDNTDARVWRYMDIPKLLSLVERGALYFVRLDKLSELDPFEGFYTTAMFKADQIPFEELPEEWKSEGQICDAKMWQLIKESNARMREFVKLQRQFTLVNSWHMQDHESAAMWAQYLKTEDGVAIQSTYKRLIDSFASAADFEINAGKVSYIDYEREGIPRGNILFPYLFKRKSFEHERELRCLIWLAAAKGVDINNPATNPVRDKAGMYVPVNLNTLLERVFVAPTAPNWVRETLESILKRFDLKIPVLQSDLASAPLY